MTTLLKDKVYTFMCNCGDIPYATLVAWFLTESSALPPQLPVQIPVSDDIVAMYIIL